MKKIQENPHLGHDTEEEILKRSINTLQHLEEMLKVLERINQEMPNITLILKVILEEKRKLK